jgi:hypothetical protein
MLEEPNRMILWHSHNDAEKSAAPQGMLGAYLGGVSFHSWEAHGTPPSRNRTRLLSALLHSIYSLI